MKVRGGEFSTGTTGNLQPELTKFLRIFPSCTKHRFNWPSYRLCCQARTAFTS